MIHYHGTPIGGSRQDCARFLRGRHALVPFPRQEDIGPASEFCQSFVLDNGAFTVWKSGGTLDIPGYMKWVNEWRFHPGFDWALIPDVIDGTAEENANLIQEWSGKGLSKYGVPIWHMHEPIHWLKTLCEGWKTVAIGSSGKWATPGTESWWRRIGEAMGAICVNGMPVCRLHGLRMLDPQIFSRLPLASADSTNAAVNSGSVTRFGIYTPATSSQRAAVIADRIESHNSSPVWAGVFEDQLQLA